MSGSTQMSSARRGIATEEMIQAAKDEDVELDLIIKRVANGSIIIPKNNARKQNNVKVVGIGHGLKTKVNVNIGTSTLYQNLNEEISKAKVAVKYGADTIMDLSDGGDITAIRQNLLEAAHITFGTVPIYQAYAHGVDKSKNPLDITADDFLDAFEQNAKDGVDYTTIHSGITKELAKRVMEVKRHAGIVSKGGTITAAWMLKYDKENPYYEYFDYMCEIARKYDVTFSLGDALRPGSILDSHDELQVAEMINVARLAKRAHQKDIQVMIAYRIAAHAGDLVKIRDKAIKWDMEITQARRMLNWEKQISLSINPEEAERIHTRREGQIQGNNAPCTMCGSACVYIMLPQQRKYV